MTRRIVRLVAVFSIAATLVAVPATAHAAAPTTAAANRLAPDPAATVRSGIQATPFCTLPYLATAYGPIAQCTEVANIKGRQGFYSPLTDVFSSNSVFYAMTQSGWLEKDVWATDGVFAHVRGYAVLITPFGATIFTTQYLGNQGRWGNFNLHTQLFYPSSEWLPIVP